MNHIVQSGAGRHGDHARLAVKIDVVSVYAADPAKGCGSTSLGGSSRAEGDSKRLGSQMSLPGISPAYDRLRVRGEPKGKGAPVMS